MVAEFHVYTVLCQLSIETITIFQTIVDITHTVYAFGILFNAYELSYVCFLYSTGFKMH